MKKINGMDITRFAAVRILEALPQTKKLKAERWYEAEDKVTEILNQYFSKYRTPAAQTNEIELLLADVLEDLFNAGCDEEYQRYQKRFAKIVGCNTDPRKGAKN